LGVWGGFAREPKKKDTIVPRETHLSPAPLEKRNSGDGIVNLRNTRWRNRAQGAPSWRSREKRTRPYSYPLGKWREGGDLSPIIKRRGKAGDDA